MLKLTLSAVIAVSTFLVFAPLADAARWCRDGASGLRCFSNYKLCARGGADCQRAPRTARRGGPVAWDGSVPAPRYPMRGQIEPSRPYWSSPSQCFFDDGGGRFVPCDQPTGGGGFN